MPNGAFASRGRGRASVEPGPTPAPWRSAHLTRVDVWPTPTRNTPTSGYWITAALLGSPQTTRVARGDPATSCWNEQRRSAHAIGWSWPRTTFQVATITRLRLRCERSSQVCVSPGERHLVAHPTRQLHPGLFRAEQYCGPVPTLGCTSPLRGHSDGNQPTHFDSDGPRT